MSDGLKKLSLDAVRLSAKPDVAAHAAAAPRVAFMHTWLATQTEGWWRYAFDKGAFRSTTSACRRSRRRAICASKYDVIVFAPVGGGSTQDIMDGLPMWGNAMPWQTTELTPNIGKLDATADMRPGLGASGRGAPPGVREQGRAADHVRGYGAVCDRERAGTGGKRCGGWGRTSGRDGVEYRLCDDHEPGGLRVRQKSSGDERGGHGVQREQHDGTGEPAGADGSVLAATDGPGDGGGQRRSAGARDCGARAVDRRSSRGSRGS